MLTKPLTKPLYNPLTRLSEGFTTLASLVKLLFANNEQGWWYDPEVAYGWWYNLLSNTAFSGGINGSPGTVPTAWSQFVTGNPTSEYANNSVRVITNTAERFQLGQVINVSANSIYKLTVDIDAVVASGVSNMVNFVAAPSGATITYEIDGVATGPFASPGSGKHKLAAILTVGATGGTVAARIGGSINVAGAVHDLIFSNPSFTTAANADKPYQKITDGIQDYYTYANPLPVLYQDSAGTTPVTAMEQNVGLILDKRLGLVLGPELVTNGDFSQGATGWTTDPGWSIAGGAATCDGSTGFLRGAIPTPLLETGKWYSVSMRLVSYTSGNVYLPYDGTGFIPLPSNAPGIYRGVFYCDVAARPYVYGLSFNGSITNISVRELPGNHGFQSTLTKRPKVSRRVNLLVGTAALATQSITTVAGAHTFKFSGAGSVTLSGTATGTYSAGTHSITCTAGTLTVTVTGAVTDASFVPTIKAHLPYQLVNTATDYDDDPAKFPTYLKPDAIDDCYVTNDIDFTATDKVNVWAGITKLSDAAAAVVLEFSSVAVSTNGAFALTAPPISGNNGIQFVSRGTAGASVNPAIPAPISPILAGIGDISGDVATLLLNGTQAAQNTLDQGTGNYGKYPLFIGARNQTSLFFGGEIYSLIGRGALSNASQHAAVNQYIKQRMMLL